MTALFFCPRPLPFPFIRSGSLRRLDGVLDGLGVLLDVGLDVGDGGLLGGLVHGDAGDLADADEGEEEVYGGEAGTKLAAKLFPP